MKKLASIIIIFENTEHALIQASDVISLCIKGISKSLHIDYIKDVHEMIICDSIELRLNKDTEYDSPWKDMFNIDTTSLLGRLQFNDITSICLLYDDTTEEQYYVTWNVDNNHSNINQSVEIQKYGKECIHVCIDKNCVKE